MSRDNDGSVARARAEARFKAPEAETGSVQGQRAAEVERQAVADKTARLRALRLAKEEQDRIAAEVRRARRQK